ncbi:MAG: hypothetical protein Q8Q14_01535 [Gemmatimonadales bacterium]|nr:hypothetical protein [Gemmatimonadales bacterium]
MTGTGRVVLLGLLTAACGPSDPCSGYQFDRLKRFSRPYAGHWVVGRGDSLTLPDAPALSDRFTLVAVGLDTATAVVGRDCLFRGRIVFARPPDTLAVTWFGQPEQAIVNGWPASVGGGSFAGLSLAWAGADSLRGSLLFSEQLGVQVRAGVTAQFVAGRAGRLSSAP